MDVAPDVDRWAYESLRVIAAHQQGELKAEKAAIMRRLHARTVGVREEIRGEWCRGNLADMSQYKRHVHLERNAKKDDKIQTLKGDRRARDVAAQQKVIAGRLERRDARAARDDALRRAMKTVHFAEQQRPVTAMKRTGPTIDGAAYASLTKSSVAVHPEVALLADKTMSFGSPPRLRRMNKYPLTPR